MRFKDLAERQILKAQAEGQLDDLEGAGKPLEKTGSETIETAGFRMMAEAGAVPREILLKRERDTQKEVLAQLTDPVARKAAMAKLADIELRLAIEQEARRKFLNQS